MTRPEDRFLDAIFHPKTEDCPDPECTVCGERDCPHGEPLHYHHDGCPACSNATFILCRNAEDMPACGVDCNVPVPAGAIDDSTWVRYVLDTPEWFVVLRSCPDHGRHADPFCSITCFTRYHAQHKHD